MTWVKTATEGIGAGHSCKRTKFNKGRARGPATPAPALLETGGGSTSAAALLSGVQSQLTAARESWEHF